MFGLGLLGLTPTVLSERTERFSRVLGFSTSLGSKFLDPGDRSQRELGTSAQDTNDGESEPFPEVGDPLWWIPRAAP